MCFPNHHARATVSFSVDGSPLWYWIAFFANAILRFDFISQSPKSRSSAASRVSSKPPSFWKRSFFIIHIEKGV